MKRTVSTDDASAAVGASSQATVTGDRHRRPALHGGAVTAATDGELFDDEPVDVQARRCLENVEAILVADGLEMSDVAKVTVFLDDVGDIDEMDGTDAGFFEDDSPARSAVEVGAVPKGAAVVIEAVAAVE